MSGNTTVRTELVETRIVVLPGGGFRALVRQQFDGRPLRRELSFDAAPDELAKTGGTLMYCPSCRCIRRCDAVTMGRMGLDPRQRFSLESNPDINWFRRVRMCRSCFYHFVTAEVSESLILEMGEMLDEKTAAPPASADGSRIIPFPKGGRRDP